MQALAATLPVKAPIAVRASATIATLLLIVALSVVPGQARSGDSAFVWLVSVTPEQLQNVAHVFAYALLAWLMVWTLENLYPPRHRNTLAFALAVIAGAGLEWYQTLVPGRFGTFTDALLNAGGALFGLLIAATILKPRARSSSKISH